MSFRSLVHRLVHVGWLVAAGRVVLVVAGFLCFVLSLSRRFRAGCCVVLVRVVRVVAGFGCFVRCRPASCVQVVWSLVSLVSVLVVRGSLW